LFLFHTEIEQQLFLLILLLGKTDALTLAHVLHQLSQDAGLRPARMAELEVDRLLGGLKRAGLVQTAKPYYLLHEALLANNVVTRDERILAYLHLNVLPC